MSPDYSSLADAVRRWARAAGIPADQVRIYFHDRPVLALPLADEPEPPAEETFVLTELQYAILDALEGKGLRVDAIAAKCDIDRRQLYNPGGLKELQARGLVAWHRRIGFFRPDAPPPEYPGEAKE